MRTRLALAALLLSCAFLPGNAQDPAPSPYGDCKGTANQLALTCTPQQCPPGCVKSTVDTAFGPAEVCFCNYIGPQPFCCKVARNLATGGITTWGQCASPGCPPDTGPCAAWAVGGGNREAKCTNILPPDDDGDDGGDDDGGDGGDGGGDGGGN